MQRPHSTVRQRAIAFHEAAHAILYRVLGLGIEEISILPGVDGSNGRTKRLFRIPEDCAAEVECEVYRREIISTLAGRIAQWKATAMEFGCDDDENWARENAIAIAILRGFPESVQERICERLVSACRLVANELVTAYWTAIVMLAEELLTRKELTGEEAETILAAAGVPAASFSA